jgi:hypothetical protein
MKTVETRIIDYAALRASYRGAMRWQRIQLRVRRWRARAAAAAAALLLSACATVQLGTVHAPAGTTADQQSLAILVCKDEAAQAVAKRQVGDFAAGLTIVGAPIAIHLDAVKQRQAFGACMAAKGYSVTI